MHASLRTLADLIRAHNGRALIVGGAVRDHLLGYAPKDFDVEVFGIAPEHLERLLRDHYTVMEVGVSFGVLKVRLPHIDEPVDISVPRAASYREQPCGDFAAHAAPDMAPQDAARRRDLTINALMLDPHSEEILDFFGGLDDLRAGRLRYNHPDTFAEDPLRVLRAAQFAARFGFDLDPDLVALARTLSLAAVSSERIGDEWRKLLLKGTRPRLGMVALHTMGQLDHAPELAALVDVRQDPHWHPEGCAWTHTTHVTDAAAVIARREHLSPEDAHILMLAAVCHDLGKATTTVFERGRWRSPHHAAAGVEPSQAWMERLHTPTRIIQRVLPLVREHMVHIGLPVKARPVRRLAHRLQPATMEQWGLLVEADHSGRPPLPPGRPGVPYVELARTLDLNANPPAPILKGRHLLDAGLKPGPHFGDILRRAFEAQLDGHFHTLGEAIDYAHQHNLIPTPSPQDTRE